MRIIDIRGTSLELTEALKTFVQEKTASLERLCGAYDPCEVSWELGKTTQGQQKGDIWRAEVHIAIPGHAFRIERVAQDVYAAIDAAKDAIKEQIIRYKK